MTTSRLRTLMFLMINSAWFCAAQVTVIDSGSTNLPGVNVKLQKSGPQALVEQRDGSQQKIMLDKDACKRLMTDLKAAGPLNELPAAHCMKSVSFGTSIFVEFNGVRSPDLSCRQTDPRAAALKTDASEILSAVRAKVPGKTVFR